MLAIKVTWRERSLRGLYMYGTLSWSAWSYCDCVMFESINSGPDRRREGGRNHIMV